MSKANKILSLLLSLVLLSSNLVYADTVVIGAAPNSGEKSISQNTSSTFLQNQYTGPGTLPTSSNNLGTSPIQYDTSATNNVGVTVDHSSNTANAKFIDEHGVSYSGPTTKTISSPAQNNAALAASKGTTNVITNGIADKGTPSSNTADAGPTSREVLAPTANGPRYSDGSGNTSDPGMMEPGAITNTNLSQSIPSYNTGAHSGATQGTIETNMATNTDIIIYQANANINAVKPGISAEGALVVNATTRQIYYAKGGFTQFAPASLANLVTAYILASYKGLDEQLSVSATAVTGLESGATTIGLKAGDTISVRDAIAAMFVKSACDVANVVAENVVGSVQNFVAMMNQTVKNWGCIGTNFVNPTGLNSDAQVTTTYDMAIIMDKATSNPNLKIMLGLPTYTLQGTISRNAKKIDTKNSLLIPGDSKYYNGIAASRMGYTSKAKYTMASMIDYNGQRLIAVVLKANGTHFTDTTKLLNFAKIASIEASTSGNATQYTGVATNVTTNVTTSGTANGMVAAGNINGTWKQDDKGWYFIKPDGTRANNEWIKQNGKMYCVDSTGYMITGWREFSNGHFYYFEPANGEFRYNTWVNVSTGAYYLQADGSLATADKGTTKNIVTSVGTYTIDENGKAIAKVN